MNTVSRIICNEVGLYGIDVYVSDSNFWELSLKLFTKDM